MSTPIAPASRISPPAISAASIGLTPRETELLAAIDQIGDGNGVATSAEFVDFVQSSMRTPEQVLPTEPWIGRQLRALAVPGNIGVRIGAGEVNRVRRRVSTQRATLEGFWRVSNIDVSIPGSTLPKYAVVLDGPIVVAEGPRAETFSTAFVTLPIAQGELPKAGDHVRATGQLETFELFYEDGRPSETYLRFKAGASVQTQGLSQAEQAHLRAQARAVALDVEPSVETMMELMTANLPEVVLEKNDVQGTGRYAVLRRETGEFFVKVTEGGPNGEEMLSIRYFGPYPYAARL